MSATPIFVKSKSDLLQRLRLGKLNAHSSSVKIINSAITEVRVRLYGALGSTRVAEILTYDQTDSPSTDEELARADAMLLEVKSVRLSLLTSLNVFFADELGDAQQEWNEAGFLRDANQEDFARQVERLEVEINDSIERLKTKDPERKSQVTATSLGPETDRAEPGGTVWP